MDVEDAYQRVLERTAELEAAQRAVEAAAIARAEAAQDLVNAIGGGRGAQSRAAEMMGIKTSTMAVLLKKARPAES